MAYEEFKNEYLKTFNRFMSYSSDQAGSQIYAERMGELYDSNPEWADKVEEEASCS